MYVKSQTINLEDLDVMQLLSKLSNVEKNKLQVIDLSSDEDKPGIVFDN